MEMRNTSAFDLLRVIYLSSPQTSTILHVVTKQMRGEAPLVRDKTANKFLLGPMLST